MKGKTALVTGGASGIGRAACIAFARAGARVAVADRSVDMGRQVVADIERLGGQALFVAVDVSHASSVAEMVDAVIRRFGRIDCAFNNAGIPDGSRSLRTSTQANWDAVMAVNLEGMWLCLKAELDHMIAQGGGSIVNNSSRSGITGVPGDAIYGAAKHGVIGLTKAAAVECARHGLRVNAVCPGLVDTALTRARFGADFDDLAKGANPMGRAAQPEEIAEAVVWLCSDAASFINGVALPIDGGRSAH